MPLKEGIGGSALNHRSQTIECNDFKKQMYSPQVNQNKTIELSGMNYSSLSTKGCHGNAHQLSKRIDSVQNFFGSSQPMSEANNRMS